MTVVSTTGRVHIQGPLETYVAGFEAELRRLGFAPASAVNQLHLVAHLSGWLDAQSLGVEDLTVERVEAFIGERRASLHGVVLPQGAAAVAGLAGRLGGYRGGGGVAAAAG